MIGVIKSNPNLFSNIKRKAYNKNLYPTLPTKLLPDNFEFYEPKIENLK